MRNKDELKKQVIVVIKLFDEKYTESEREGVLELIYKRYNSALKQLENNEVNKEELHILGGIRAYMDSYSDYNNPLLNEMHKAEELVKKLS